MGERTTLDKLLLNDSLCDPVRRRYTARIHTINKEIEDIHGRDKLKQERKAVDEIDSNPSYFFKYANSTRKTRSRIGPLKSGMHYTSGEKEMADILSRQYHSIFTKPTDMPYHFKQTDCLPIHNITISPAEISVSMESIKPTSSPGPNGIPANMFIWFAAIPCIYA